MPHKYRCKNIFTKVSDRNKWPHVTENAGHPVYKNYNSSKYFFCTFTSKNSRNTSNTFTRVLLYNHKTGRMFSDQIGKLPHTSSCGNKYIMMWHHYNINDIIAQPMKNRIEAEINKAYTIIHNKLQKMGYTPNTHRLDNE